MSRDVKIFTTNSLFHGRLSRGESGHANLPLFAPIHEYRPCPTANWDVERAKFVSLRGVRRGDAGWGARRSNLDLRSFDVGAQIASSSRTCGTPRNDNSEVIQQSQLSGLRFFQIDVDTGLSSRYILSRLDRGLYLLPALRGGRAKVDWSQSSR
jgi:hypothetical protein